MKVGEIMSELTAKKRNSLDEGEFGIPSLRKFPLNDAEHVRKAIQFFHHCPMSHKNELATNIYHAANKYNVDIRKDSPIYEYLPKRLQENFEYEDFWDWEGIGEEFDQLLLEVFITEIEAQEKVDSAIQAWREKAKSVKTPPEKTALMVQVKNERTAVSSLLAKGDFIGVIKKASNSRSIILNSIKNLDAKMQGQARSNPNAIKSMGAGVASKATGVANKIGETGRGAGQAAVPLLKTAVTIGAAAAGAKIGSKVAGSAGAGAVKRTAVGAGAGLAAGAAAKNLLTFNNRRAADDQSIRKHAMKYVSFITKFADEVNAINVSATSGAIQPMQQQKR